MRPDYATHIERDEQGRAVRLVFGRIPASETQEQRDDMQHSEGQSRGVTPQHGAQDAIPRCSCGAIVPNKIRWRGGRFCSRRCKDRSYNAAHPVARQRPLPLDPSPAPVPPVVDQTVKPAERPRLKGQNARILERLRQGPVTNRQLVEISLKYTSRVSDVRAWLRRHTGETIPSPKDLGGGLTRYWIEPL
jgi:hypothetical protein